MALQLPQGEVWPCACHHRCCKERRNQQGPALPTTQLGGEPQLAAGMGDLSACCHVQADETEGIAWHSLRDTWMSSVTLNTPEVTKLSWKSVESVQERAGSVAEQTGPLLLPHTVLWRCSRAPRHPKSPITPLVSPLSLLHSTSSPARDRYPLPRTLWDCSEPELQCSSMYQQGWELHPQSWDPHGNMGPVGLCQSWDEAELIAQFIQVLGSGWLELGGTRAA